MKILPVLLSVIVMSTVFVFAGDTGDTSSGKDKTDDSGTTDQHKPADAKQNEVSAEEFLQNLKKAQHLTAEDLNVIVHQSLFSGEIKNNYSPAGFYYQFHNPFADKIIYAIQVQISVKGQSINLLIMTDCAPLTSTDGCEHIYNSSIFGDHPDVKVTDAYYTR